MSGWLLSLSTEGFLIYLLVFNDGEFTEIVCHQTPKGGPSPCMVLRVG